MHTETTDLLAEACRWIRKHANNDRTRLRLARDYVGGLDDLTPLQLAVERLGVTLSDSESQARDQIVEYLAQRSRDLLEVIDLTLEEAGIRPRVRL